MWLDRAEQLMKVASEIDGTGMALELERGSGGSRRDDDYGQTWECVVSYLLLFCECLVVS